MTSIPGWQTVRCQGCGQERYAPVGQTVEQCPWCPSGKAEKPLTAAQRTLNIPGVDLREQDDQNPPKLPKPRRFRKRMGRFDNTGHLVEGRGFVALCQAECDDSSLDGGGLRSLPQRSGQDAA